MFLNENKGSAQNYEKFDNCDKCDKEIDKRWEKRERAMGESRNEQACEAIRQRPLENDDNKAVTQNYAHFGKIANFESFGSLELNCDNKQIGDRERVDSSGESQLL